MKWKLHKTLIINQFNQVKMKTINKYSYFFILLVLLATIGFVSCAKDEGTVIVPRTTEDYKLQMSQFVNSEKAKTESCVIGYDKGNFKVASTSNFVIYKTAYLAVLDSANIVLSNDNVTITQIVNTNKAIVQRAKNFNGSLFISDRRPLADPIVAAETLNAAHLVGTEPGKVPQDAKTAYTSAITSAKAIRDATATIDRQVQDGVKILETATTTFNSAIIK